MSTTAFAELSCGVAAPIGISHHRFLIEVTHARERGRERTAPDVTPLVPEQVDNSSSFDLAQSAWAATVVRALLSYGTAAMQTYNDFAELALICARNAHVASSREASAVLWKMAIEHRDKAAKLNGGKAPEIGEPPQWLAS